jgi:hypothetical protein
MYFLSMTLKLFSLFLYGATLPFLGKMQASITSIVNRKDLTPASPGFLSQVRGVPGNPHSYHEQGFPKLARILSLAMDELGSRL